MLLKSVLFFTAEALSADVVKKCARVQVPLAIFTAEALSADVVKKCASGDRQALRILKRIVVDMARDMMDVQFYTGEYAMKKFEVARDMLPELYAGLCRLKEQLQAEEAPDAIASQPANTAQEASASVPAAPPRTLSFYHILFLFWFFLVFYVVVSMGAGKIFGFFPESFSEGFFVKLRRPYNTTSHHSKTHPSKTPHTTARHTPQQDAPHPSPGLPPPIPHLQDRLITFLLYS